MDFRSALVAACLAVVCSGLASARTIEGLESQVQQSTRGRHLLAHIEQEELRHLGRGLRAAADTYSYGDGIKEWGGICQQGDKIPEAPIDIPKSKIKEATAMPSGAMDFNYANFTGATAVNTGHGVQVNMPEGNFLTIGSEKWKLLQYHFHSPSENALAGKLSSMELHLVHSNVDTGDLAVVGILLNPTGAKMNDGYSSALDQALNKAPATIKDVSDPFNLNVNTFTSLLNPVNALPKGKLTGAGSVPVVAFNGSLTTPPCTAGVQWYVVVKQSPVGPGQVLTFQRFVGNGTSLSQNNRPLQPTLGRDLSVKL